MAYQYSSQDPLHPENLKTKQRTLREGFPKPLTLRVHRALSWLRRAEDEGEDDDVRFILLWIGFNAAYLLEVLKHMATDEVKMTFRAPERAATIEPVAPDGEDALDYLCLVMPLRLLD